MDDLTLNERVAQPGDVVETEPCFELTAQGLEYVARHEPG